MPNTSFDVGRQESKDEEEDEGIWVRGGWEGHDKRSRKAWQPKSGTEMMRMDAGRGCQEMVEMRITGDR